VNQGELWSAIDTQRLRTIDVLDELTPTEWEVPSLCAGWTVRDVAAHLTLQQLTVGSALLAALRHPGSLNHVIHASARDRATLPTDRLVAEIRSMVGSRRHNVGVTPLETLIDIVVHGQDIAIPLGRELAVLPSAAATVADRLWWSRSTRRGRLKSKVFADVNHRGLRFVATDSDWSAGDGDEVGAHALEGPGASRLGRRPVVVDSPAARPERPTELPQTTEEEA
jgi:uncharacterized protein (TIGR03083 family)